MPGITVKYGGSRMIIYSTALLSKDLASESLTEPDNWFHTLKKYYEAAGQSDKCTAGQSLEIIIIIIT